MKYIVSTLLLIMLGFGSLHAGEEGEVYEKKQVEPYKQVERFNGGFEVTLNDDHTVTASWDSFEGEGFDWYKLMYSTTNSAPVYPDDKVVFVGSKDDNSNTFKLGYGKNHYIRICAITGEANYQKGRYCSEVKKIQTELTGSVKKFTATKKEAINKYETTKAVKETNSNLKKVELTTKLKDRVDNMLEKFMNRLESKGYGDEKKLQAIERIMDKLEILKQKNDRYARLVDYMMEQLEAYRDEIDDGFEEIESLFEDF